jgi:hypothetical protein
MLGLGDGWVAAAYWLCLASSVLCIVYGALKWNSGAEDAGEDDRHWAEEETKIKEDL